MSKVALVVHIGVVAGGRDEFVQIVRAHGENSVTIEEGCLHFEVLIPSEVADQVILLEKYSHRAALDLHWNSDHMAAYREKVKDLIKNRTAHICSY